MRIEAKDKRKHRAILGDCKKCPLQSRPAVIPTPCKRPALTIIGEAPGEIEEEKGEFFSGPTGRFVQRAVERHKLSWERVYRDNALLCRPDRKLSKQEWKEAMAACSGRLARTAASQKPKVVLAFGKKAMQAVTGRAQLFDWCGTPMKGKGPFEGKVCIATPHPTFALRKGKRAYLPVIAIHVQRAVLMARKKLENWTWPKLIIEPGDEAVAALQEFQRKKERVSVDIETYGQHIGATMLAVGIGTRRVSVSMPWDEYTAGKHGDVAQIAEQPRGVEIAKLIRAILSDEQIPKVLQNGQFDIRNLRTRGMRVNNYAVDNLFQHAVAAPQLPHKLGFMAGIETNAPAWKAEFHVGSDLKGAAKFARQNPVNLRTYNAKDNVMQDTLADILQERVEETHNGQALFDRYMQLGRLALEMCDAGMAVSDEKRLEHQGALRTRLYRARGELQAITTHLGKPEFNPNSNAQLNWLYFKKLKVRPTKWSDETGNPSLDEEVLSGLVVDPRPVVAALSRGLLRYRRWSTLLGKYVEGLPVDRSRRTPVVHPVWKVAGAITGRWSCDAPNLHNIPKPIEKRLKDGTKQTVYPGLRDMYVARPGYQLGKADKSQLELRIIALLSGDAKLLQWYREGRDVHTMNAIELFGVTEPSKSERTLIKNFVYNANYGGGAETIWRLLVVDFPELPLRAVRKMIDDWFRAHPWIVRWQAKQLAKATKLGYSEGPFTGRRRYYYGHIEPTEVYNFDVQETASHIVNEEILALSDALSVDEHILLQVHDEIVMESKDKRMPYKMAEAMNTTLSYEGNEMRFTNDIAVGLNWAEGKEVLKNA